jgi:micrococcal nuclease
VKFAAFVSLLAATGIALAGCGDAPTDAAVSSTGSPTTTSNSSDNTPVAPTTTTTATAPTTTANTTTAKTQTGRPMVVQRVVDGDTVKLAAVAGGAVVTARLLGIDTPETKDPRKGLGCWGSQASAWATGLLTGQRVRMRTDPTQDSRDKYGRALVYLTLPSGQDYSVEAARRGMAKYYLYDTPVNEAAKIQAAAGQARSAGRGLWGPPCYGRTAAALKTSTPKQKTAAAKRKTVTTAPPAHAGGSTYYKNCSAARAAGAAPLHTGDPGYSSKLDRDHDGIACE